jgi:hypothetical protein
MTPLQAIQQFAQSHPEGKVIFDEPITVKSSPHHLVFTVFGIWQGENGLFVMDGEGQWHGALSQEQVFGDLMIASIYQRVKALQLNSTKSELSISE